MLGFAPTLAWLFVGRLIAGITGASFTTAGAYIADVSPPEKRAQNFGLIGAAFGLGFIMGPVLGGFLGEYGARVPFFVSAGLTLINWLNSELIKVGVFLVNLVIPSYSSEVDTLVSVKYCVGLWQETHDRLLFSDNIGS